MKQLVYRYSILAEHTRIIKEIKAQNMKAGLAIKPKTEVEKIDPFCGEMFNNIFSKIVT